MRCCRTAYTLAIASPIYAVEFALYRITGRCRAARCDALSNHNYTYISFACVHPTSALVNHSLKQTSKAQHVKMDTLKGVHIYMYTFKGVHKHH